VTPQIDLLSAALVGRYRIERELGAGGMASVYLAQDLKHDRRVAIKVLRPELAAVIGAERFLSEIKTTANLQHPHILPLHDSGEVNGTVFYVMPYIEGESLREKLVREKQLPVADAVRIATEVADALDYAHRHGVIHRDIKPENILLHDGRALVADFGIALAASKSEGSTRLTETGMSLGTPHYMSPEQAMGERSLDARTDVYALGCVLYELLTGEPPFDGPTAQAIVARVMAADPEPVTTIRKTVPPGVAAAVHMALQKVPADRFASAAEMAEALADTAGTRGLAALPATSATGPARRTFARVAPWGVAVLGVAAAVVIALRAPKPIVPRAIRFAISSPDIMTAGDFRSSSVAISPDGRDIVFVGSSRSQTRLYRRSVDGTEITPLEGTDGARGPAISADGWVAFWTPDGRVHKVALAGGRSVRIGSTEREPIGTSWSSKFGLVMGMLAFSSQTGLTRFDASGDTTLHVITTPGAPMRGMHHQPYVLEGGEYALMVDYAAGQPNALAVASLKDGTWQRLTLSGPPPSYVVGVARGVLLYALESGAVMRAGWDAQRRRSIGDPVAVPDIPAGTSAAVLAEDGTLAMVVSARTFSTVLVDDRGAEESILPAESIDQFFPRFAPGGHRAAVSANYRGTRELWLYDVDAHALTQLGIGFDPQLVDWTPDGRRVVAGGGATAGGGRGHRERMGRGGRGAPADTDATVVDARGVSNVTALGSGGAVWARAADASDQPSVFLQLAGHRVAGVALSPDRRSVAITENTAARGEAARYNILIARADGDTTVVPFAVGDANELAPRFSPDGKWIAYASDESGHYEVYVRPYPGPGARVQVSENGGGQPVWAPDGRRVFYRADRAMMTADLTIAGNTLSVARRARMFEGDYFGTVESPVANYDVAADGRHFLMARAANSGGGSIVVWANWLQELTTPSAGGSR
jgi:serine/threonine-protein kinase